MALSKMVKGTDLVSEVPKIDLNTPNYDQSSYLGRAKHFFEVTNPATILLSKKKLFQAKELLEQYKYVSRDNCKRIYIAIATRRPNFYTYRIWKDAPLIVNC